MTEAEFKKHLEAAENSPKEIAAAVSGLSEELLHYKPPADKWCVLEVLGHLADVEIVYGYRLQLMLADEKPVIAPWTRMHGQDISGTRRLLFPKSLHSTAWRVTTI